MISSVSGESPRLASCYGQWTENDGPHLSGGEPQGAAIGEPESPGDSGQDLSASGSCGYCWTVPYREVLSDEPPGRTESR